MTDVSIEAVEALAACVQANVDDAAWANNQINMHYETRQRIADAIIRALANDGAEIRWRGDTIEIYNDEETITVIFESRRR